MPLNKFAAWGVEPIATLRPPGLGGLLRARLQALDKTIGTELATIADGVTRIADRLPGPPAPPVPSSAALRVIWSLNAVRDALSDQGEPSLGSTNAQIGERRASQAVKEITDFLYGAHRRLQERYLAQFRLLDDFGDDFLAFDRVRRERLAELTAFEVAVMAEVGDPPVENEPPAGSPPQALIVASARAGRGSTKRR
jgi:hypothetical protein